MTRKRRRVRPKPKVAVEAPNEDMLAVDSGNDSPQTDNPKPWSEEKEAHCCSESIKAWKFYQACILERYHWFLDEKRRSIASYYSRRITDVYLRQSPADVLGAAGDLETSMSEELSAVDEDEQTADEIFSENIKALEAGKPMNDLPLIDTRVTPEQVSKFILKYSSCDDQTDLKKGSMNQSFTGSTSSEDSGLLMTDQIGCLSLMPDDLWKPDEQLFNGSFSVDQFYQPSVKVGSMPVDEAPPVHEMTPASTCPNIADEDSAIKAVVYSQDTSTLAGHEPLTLTTQEPPTLTGHDPFPLTPFDPLMLGTQNPAIMVTQELPTEEAPLHTLALSVGAKSKTALANFEHSLSHLTAEYETTPQVDENAICHSVVPLVESSSHTSHLFKESSVLPEGSAMDGQIGDKPYMINAADVQEVIKNRKPNEAPVKFVDQKTFGAKDTELVKDIIFSWSEQNAEDEGENIEVEPSASGETKAVTTIKPTMSFAAVAASAPLTVLKEPPAKAATSGADKADQKVIFSTKKPARKFGKTSCLNKTSLCWTYVKSKKCPWGDECIYAHGQKELRPFPKWFDKNHVSSNGKVVKPPHEEPCDDHYCRWRRHHLLTKTSLCKHWEGQRCPNTAESCQFAHGSAELRPLPKLEMCRLNQKGKCNFKSSECVYAHDASELRKKKRKKAKKNSVAQDVSLPPSSPLSRLRTISETSASSYETSFSAVVGSSRVRTISGTSWQSESSQGMRDLEEFDWHAWNSQAEVPAEEELDESWNEDECVICSHEFTDVKPKHMLECEHTNFHEKCIEQWLERNKTCPMCRCPADNSVLFTDEQWHLE